MNVDQINGQQPTRALYREVYSHSSVLEKLIREYPEQYFWLHRRWKHQPDPRKPPEVLAVDIQTFADVSQS